MFLRSVVSAKHHHSQSSSNLIWQRCYSQSYRDCFIFFPLFKLFHKISSPPHKQIVGEVEPIKTDGHQVSLCKHKLLHSRSLAAEPCVMDADIITVLSRSWEAYAVHEGVMLEPQSQPWRDK